jgi:hypothetical protein
MFLVTDSTNSKLGNCSATYLPIKQTCSSACPLKDSSCYAQFGFVAYTVKRLESNYKGIKAYDIVRAEAREISAFKGKVVKPLRLHVSGDVRTDAAAKLLANAAENWNNKVWTYTHSWRSVKRSSFGKISVFASVENTADAKIALEKGYAPAIVAERHESDRAYMKDGVKLIPCPAQTRNVNCEACKLCMNADSVKVQGAAIAFAVHGSGKKRALKVIQ